MTTAVTSTTLQEGECITADNNRQFFGVLTWLRDAACQHCWLISAQLPSILLDQGHPILMFVPEKHGAPAVLRLCGCGC